MSAKKAKKEKSAFGPISVNIVLFVIGLCLAIWADKVTNIMSIVLGILLLLVASYYVIDYFRDNKREDADGEISKLIAAIFLAIVGLFFISNANFIKDFISIVIGAGLAISGLSGLHDALDLKKSNPNEYKKPLIFAILSVIFGTLCILGKLVVPDLMLTILGVMMMFFSISSSCTTAYTVNITKKNKADIKRDNAIEAEIIDQSEKKSKK